jgi:SAM-dependent methyltransferase
VVTAEEPSSYGIRPDYRPNHANLTLDERSGKTYWNEQRIATSARYQYHAYRAALALARRRGARTVVDLGCGVATKLNRFFGAEFEIVGVDQPAAIEVCRRRFERGTYIAENFEQPAFALARAVEQVDLLICSDVIEHLEDPDLLLDYVRRVVTPAAAIVLTTPDRVALLGPDALAPVNPAHIREWSCDEFARYVDSRGFEVLEHRRFPPFRLGFDRLTAKFLRSRLRRRLPLATNQMLVCRVREQG